MDIAGINLETPVVLAPMAGVTSLAYREFMKPFGVGLSVSEMISDCGIVYGNDRTFDYLKTSEKDRPVALQLFGFSRENALKAVEVVEQRASFDFLDLNFGCPVRKVTKTGAGSAWLKNPTALYEYVKAIVNVSHHPVTAKIRLGWDDANINAFEVASLLERAGIKMLAVHARTAAQGYSGKADYTRIAGLGERLSIPVCVSGDIFTASDAMRAMEIVNAKLVMVARGGVGNPTLVSDIVNAIKGNPLNGAPSLTKQAVFALDFSKMLKDEKGERVAAMELRGLLPHFFKSAPGFKRIRNEIAVHCASYADIERVLEGVLRRGEKD